MTPTTTDPYAGASQPAAEVAGRAVGAPTGDDQPRAQGDGYFTADDGVRRKVIAGDPVPPGVTLEGTSTSSSSDSEQKAAKPAEDKARKAPAESK